jgi:hypothetical protein
MQPNRYARAEFSTSLCEVWVRLATILAPRGGTHQQYLVDSIPTGMFIFVRIPIGMLDAGNPDPAVP